MYGADRFSTDEVRMHGLEPGMRVAVIEGDKNIDMAIVCSVGTAGCPETDKIEIESSVLYPGEKTEFILQRDGWRMLFEDPMSDGDKCYSQRSPAYKIEPA